MSSRPASSVLATAARRCAAPAPKAPCLPLQTQSCFSTTPRNQKTTRARVKMYRWLERKAQEYKEDVEQPTYVGSRPNQPFPLNPFFRSERVLSQEVKRTIYNMVTKEKWPLKAVSEHFSVDVRRIAAVVRMATMEDQWKKEGKPLATPLANALRNLVPQTHLARDGQKQPPHEPIHELHVHKMTLQQLFVPVAESREFSRQDAAAAFHPRMLTPDERAPHPEVIQMLKDRKEGVSDADSRATFRKVTRAQEDQLVAAEERRRDLEEKRTSRIDSGRFEFRFKDVSIDGAGKNGRGRDAIGMRYGVPFNDRKKGAVKIPTSVP